MMFWGGNGEVRKMEKSGKSRDLYSSFLTVPGQVQETDRLLIKGPRGSE